MPCLSTVFGGRADNARPAAAIENAAGQYGKVDEGIQHFARLVERLAEAADETEQRGG
jgi:hypothetical protein